MKKKSCGKNMSCKMENIILHKLQDRSILFDYAKVLSQKRMRLGMESVGRHKGVKYEIIILPSRVCARALSRCANHVKQERIMNSTSGNPNADQSEMKHTARVASIVMQGSSSIPFVRFHRDSPSLRARNSPSARKTESVVTTRKKKSRPKSMIGNPKMHVTRARRRNFEFRWLTPSSLAQDATSGYEQERHSTCMGKIGARTRGIQNYESHASVFPR